MATARWIPIVLTLLLAGCVGGDASTGTSSASLEAGDVIVADETVTEAISDPGAVPRWNVGDAWSITSHGFGAQESSFLVVTAATSDAYTLSTTSEQEAGYDAMFDISYIGQLRASDLAGSQQGTPILYYSWPLAEGKTWTTTWDGLAVTLTATAKPAGGFTIVGVADGTDYVNYDYDPELKWWSYLNFVRDEYGITIGRLETGWTGEVASALAKEVYASSTTAPVASANSGAFTIDEGQSFAMVTLAGGGAQWARAFHLIDPSGAPYSTTTINDFEADGAGMYVYHQEQIPAIPGEWQIASPALHDPSGGFTLTVHQVAVSKLAVGA